MCYNVFVACVAELVDAHDSKSDALDSKTNIFEIDLL